jgi:hypothetical protein
MNKSLILSLLSIFLVSFLAFALFAQETITVTTYYPSPFGSYRTLQVINTDQEIMMGQDAVNPGIEVRSRTNNGRVPYIDFSNDDAIDFDARVILTGDNILEIQGASLVLTGLQLNIDAALTTDPLNGILGYTAQADFRNKCDNIADPPCAPTP